MSQPLDWECKQAISEAALPPERLIDAARSRNRCKEGKVSLDAAEWSDAVTTTTGTAGRHLVEAARPFRIEQHVRQRCMLLGGRTRVAGHASEPRNHTHNVGVHHCNSLGACDGCNGVACVGSHPCPHESRGVLNRTAL